MGADGTSIPRRYLARAPWIGPILGELIGPAADRRVRVAGASDPLLGKAQAAALVPVREEGGQFVPWNPRGEPLGWAAALKSDRKGRFEMHLPAWLWDGGVKGVLLILVYDYSIKRGKLSLEPAGVKPISGLPDDVKAEMGQRIRTFLEAPMQKLRAGLVEIDVREVLQTASAPPSDLAFAIASCQYPAGFLDRELAEASYKRLERCMDKADLPARPKCLLLLGDQIYADATAGLFDPTARYDRFDLPYERLLRVEPLQQVLRRVPTYTMLDDHEIEDNWEPIAAQQVSSTNLMHGRLAYLYYQRMAGPDQLAPVDDSKEPLWYTFEVNGFHFFMADTRTERSSRTARDIEDARIMSKGQFSTLLAWLERHKGDERPKFIASPACFLPRHVRAIRCVSGALRSDAWDGFPCSFHALLAHIAKERIRNVVFLSGDEHVSFVARGTLRAEGSEDEVVVHSIHSSALYSPFPFANSIYDSLACEDRFRVGNSPYSCEVSTTFRAPGDGFALLEASCENGRARVRCRFDRESGAEKWIDVV